VVITDPDSSPPSVVVALGNGDCSFTEEDTEPSGGTGGFDPFDVVAADLDGDSDPDVAVTNQESNSVRIFRNDGTGNLEELDTVETGPGTNPTGIGAGKLTGDAGVDLAVALSGTGEAVVLENEGSNFDPGPAFDMANDDAPSPVGIVVGRLDSADKKADIATSNVDVGDADDDYVAVARGFGNGNFSSPTFYSSGGDSPFSLTLGNFNRESGTDIAAANQYANAPATANNGDISILTNRGNGTFVGPDVFDTGDGPNDITAGKFNGDRKADIATANFGDDDPNTVDSVSVLLNTTRR
jgi:hypothetical protein